VGWRFRIVFPISGKAALYAKRDILAEEEDVDANGDACAANELSCLRPIAKAEEELNRHRDKAEDAERSTRAKIASELRSVLC
jgi:hypothetical protein